MALRQDELNSFSDDVDLERDRALVERCQAGDAAAFGNLYARYYDRLLRFCLRRLNDRHEAEDAAQEAFARAWKALPRFAGERRFYPWLTVIAGNICTDMLRRRSRSTPTDDMELTAQHPVGVVGDDTSEELVLAAVDGELVNRALGRLSARHRHVLAMREGSGWTYQEIADHEGVEIGTIETLLWRARQALKREFAVVSDSKEALAGFLIATGALLKRGFFRVAHRGASLHHQSGGSGDGLRNAVAGVAVTGAAVAAAFIAPHAFTNNQAPTPGAPGAALAAPRLVLGDPVGDSGGPAALGSGGSGSGVGGGGLGAGSGGSDDGSGGPVSQSGSNAAGLGTLGGLGTILGGTSAGSSGGLSSGLNQTAGGVNNTVGGVANGLGGTIGGLTHSLGDTVGGATNGVGGAVGGAASGVGGTIGGAGAGLNDTVNGVGQTVNGLTQTLGLGSVLPPSGSGSSGSGSGTGAGASTPVPTTPTTSLVGGLGGSVGGLLGG